MNLLDLQRAIGEWSEQTFPDDSPMPKLHHLMQEVGELLEAPYDRTEYADCLILLIDAARKAGIPADELIRAADEKLAVNKQRIWGQPDHNGVVHHITFDPAQPELFGPTVWWSQSA